MLKWFLIAGGFFAVIVAIFVGVVLFVFDRDGSNTDNLTEVSTAEVVESKDLSAREYMVVYAYDFDGQTYYGKGTTYSDGLDVGSALGICLDPNDPAWHALTYTDCGPGGPRGLTEGTEKKPSLR